MKEPVRDREQLDYIFTAINRFLTLTKVKIISVDFILGVIRIC